MPLVREVEGHREPVERQRVHELVVTRVRGEHSAHAAGGEGAAEVGGAERRGIGLDLADVEGDGHRQAPPCGLTPWALALEAR